MLWLSPQRDILSRQECITLEGCCNSNPRVHILFKYLQTYIMLKVFYLRNSNRVTKNEIHLTSWCRAKKDFTNSPPMEWLTILTFLPPDAVKALSNRILNCSITSSSLDYMQKKEAQNIETLIACETSCNEYLPVALSKIIAKPK